MKTILAAFLAIITVAQDTKAKDAESVLKEFKAAYNAAAKDANARAQSVKILSQVQDPKTLSALAKLVYGDGTGGEEVVVRVAAAEEIGKFKSVKGAANALQPALKNRDRKLVDVRRAAVESTGALDAHEALPILHKIHWEKPFDLALASVRATADIRDRSSVYPLIQLLREVERLPEPELIVELPIGGLGLKGAVLDDHRADMRERHAKLFEPTLEALGKITGQSFRSHKEYQAWWSREGSRFKVKE
jgi:hypothetical protein